MSALSLRTRDPGTRRRAPERKRRAGGGGRPPHDGGDDGDDGGEGWRGGDGAEDDDEPRRTRPDDHELARFGLGLLMIGIGALFLVFVASFLYLRTRQPEWPPPGQAGMPLGLWASTLILIASSVTMQRAVSARAPRTWLVRTLFLGALFLGVQGLCWARLISAGALPSDDLYLALFYAVTGLHALHLVGGLIALRRAARRARDADQPHPSIATCARYWHFMGVVWVVLFALLWAPSGGSV